MNDFRKGLVVGMLIIIGCGTFIASNSNGDVGRYRMERIEMLKEGIFLLDTKTGETYLVNPNKSKDKWVKWKSIEKTN